MRLLAGISASLVKLGTIRTKQAVCAIAGHRSVVMHYGRTVRCTRCQAAWGAL